MSRVTRGARRSLTRRGESAELLVVGLGNPGSKFSGTRHNLGREVVDEVVQRKDLAMFSKLFLKYKIDTKTVIEAEHKARTDPEYKKIIDST